MLWWLLVTATLTLRILLLMTLYLHKVAGRVSFQFFQTACWQSAESRTPNETDHVVGGDRIGIADGSADPTPLGNV